MTTIDEIIDKYKSVDGYDPDGEIFVRSKSELRAMLNEASYKAFNAAKYFKSEESFDLKYPTFQDYWNKVSKCDRIK
jgi:hypothetical protein